MSSDQCASHELDPFDPFGPFDSLDSLEPRGERPGPSAATGPSAKGARARARRVVLVSERPLSGPELDRFIAAAAPAEVVVVAPASSGLARLEVSDTALERRAARQRLERLLRELRDRGLEATGQVGDADFSRAIDEACRIYHPDAVVVPCPEAGPAGRHARELVARARSPALPVHALAACPPGTARREAA